MAHIPSKRAQEQSSSEADSLRCHRDEAALFACSGLLNSKIAAVDGLAVRRADAH